MVTCTSCKTATTYLVKDYLNYLANKSGISESNNIEDNFEALLDWNVVLSKDSEYFDENLNYSFLSRTICNLLEKEGNPEEIIYKNGYVDKKFKNNSIINKETAESIVDRAVKEINSKEFDRFYNYEYLNKPKLNDFEIGDLYFDSENNKYKIVEDYRDGEYIFRDAEFVEVFSKLDISDTYEIDFSNAEVIPLQEEITDSAYINNNFNLLASKNHVFNANGFRISYTLNSSGIDVHVSKKLDLATVYADASINAIKPSFKWTYEKGDLKNCYFNLKMNTTSTIGATIGKYGNYYLKLKELDAGSFMDSVKSMIVPKSDEVEAVIPICEVKTPIPNIPLAYIDLTVGVKLYVSGKIELVLYNAHNMGFEVKNGNTRFFWEHDDDLDGIAYASGKSALAINLALDAATFRLCDVELDGGLKAQLKSTVHLYDSDFNETQVDSDIPYSILTEISKENPNVKICGDVSLYWLLDLVCNTSKTVMKKLGFSKTWHILDEDNQVFGNLHHIEDGQFVKTCTRKSKPVIKDLNIDITSANKILLVSYAEVLLQNETYEINVIGLPNGYALKDIKYSSSDNTVAKVNNGIISALKQGNAKIRVYTSDNKYNSYINILVSTG